MEPKQFEEYLHEWEQASLKRAWNFVSSFCREIKPKTMHLVQGEPGFAIPKFAKDHNVDLVVMGMLLPFVDAAQEAVDQLCAFFRTEPASSVREPDSSIEEQSR